MTRTQPGGPAPHPRLRLGARDFDLEHRALVMAILNRTPDSFYDRGAHWAFDDFLRRAEECVAGGADILDVGGQKAGPGGEDVAQQEEIDRVAPSVEALAARFDVPISVDTWDAKVLEAGLAAGGVMANDVSGFADPGYLDVARRAGAAVVASHIRLAPRQPDPEPCYGDLVAEVRAFLEARVARARAAGFGPDQIVVDTGLDLGKTHAQSAVLLRESGRFADLGCPLLLSASNKPFLGALLGGAGLDGRREASLVAAVYGVAHGCRIVRAHDVTGTVRALRVTERILEARADRARRTGVSP